jgi:hypothetical protein
MSSQSEVIETTVSQVAAELVRRGLDRDDRVTITIEPDGLIPGWREARARVVAAGLSDEGVDRLIDEARTEARRCSNEGCGRHECLCQRGAKGKIATGYGRTYRGGERPPPQIDDHRARAIHHPCPPSCATDPAALSEVLAAAELVTITDRIAACRDPKEDKFWSWPSTAVPI